MGFRRIYHEDFWHILHTTNANDVGILIEGLDEWPDHSENLAMLVDRLDYWLNSEYTSWVTDPDDPEVKRRRAEQKRAGIKPPPQPMITPVAHRPRQVMDELVKELMTKTEQQKQEAPKRRFGTLADLRAMRGE